MPERSSNTVRIFSVNGEGVLQALKERAIAMGRRGPRIKKIVLFGSFAKGTYAPGAISTF